MTQEEKSLLYKNLCARLPYGVILQVTLKDKYDEVVTRDIRLTSGNISYLEQTSGHWFEYKPYLRPMKSMTKSEKEEIRRIKESICSYGVLPGTIKIDDEQLSILHNFYNKHHLDYCNFISKSIAIEATKDMYNNL